MEFGEEDPALVRINQLIDKGSCWEAARELVQNMRRPDLQLSIDEGTVEGILYLGFVATPTEEFVSDVEAFLKERR